MLRSAVRAASEEKEPMTKDELLDHVRSLDIHLPS